MPTSRLLALAAAAATLSPAAAGAEQRRTLSVTAEVVSSCTVTTDAHGAARASCEGGDLFSVSRKPRQRGRSSGPRPSEAAGGAKTGGVELVTLTF